MPERSAIDLSKPIEIGGHLIRNRAFLAPMSGVTDVPMRQLAWRFGAGLVVSEMVASEAFVEGEAEMQLKVQSAGLPLHMVQLAGREAQWMARAAKVAQEQGADILDINMGCPAKRVTTGYSGSALMRDLDHALTLIDAVVEAVEIPVTLKMRLGWDDQSINAPELAKRAEDAGVHMITVHGRTRNQFYKGFADWTKVKQVRDATSLPLVVNGDIKDQKSSEQAIALSGADAVMAGRACYGNPWLLGALAGKHSQHEVVSFQNNADIIIEHHEMMLSFYGYEAGIRQARKHVGWYLDNLQFGGQQELKALKALIMTSFDTDLIHKELANLLDLAKLPKTEAA